MITKFQLFEDYTDDFYDSVIGYGKSVTIYRFEYIEPTLRGLIRDNVDFDFYYRKSIEDKLTEYLIMLKDRKQLKEKNILPSIEKDQWYASPITKNDWSGSPWTKVDDIELFIDANKYNI